MTVTITEGVSNQENIKRILSANQSNRRAVRQGMYDAGKRLTSSCQKSIKDKSKKTGRVYVIRRGKSRVRRFHRASAPGEFPAHMYGNLQDSIGFDVHGVDELEFGSRSVINKKIVGKGNVQRTKSTGDVIKAPYNVYLEEGTRKMAKRPYLRPTINNEEQTIAGIMQKTIDDVLKGKL